MRAIAVSRPCSDSVSDQRDPDPDVRVAAGPEATFGPWVVSLLEELNLNFRGGDVDCFVVVVAVAAKVAE